MVRIMKSSLITNVAPGTDNFIWISILGLTCLCITEYKNKKYNQIGKNKGNDKAKLWISPNPLTKHACYQSLHHPNN